MNIKKNTAIILALLLLILTVGVIMLMKPSTSDDVDAESQQANYADGEAAVAGEPVATTEFAQGQTSAAQVSPNPDADNATISSDAGSTTDFNKKVYGYSDNQIKTNTEDGKPVDINKPAGLINPASDKSIKPIDPVKDPANQIYSVDDAPQNLNFTQGPADSSSN